MQFVHLHLHSHYSLLDGLSKVPDLVKTAVAQGAPALALTDHGSMYGAIELYLECKKAGIKPIVGCEVYVTAGNITDREMRRGEKNYFHLTLLAKNHEGYVNLMKLTSEAHLRGFYYKPRIDHEVLAQYSAGLICLSGCLNGEVAQAIRRDDLGKARELIAWHHQLFGENYYLEVQPHPNIPEQQKVNDALIEFASEFNLPLVATSDSHYLCREDAEAQDILLCIQTGAKVDETNRMSMMGEFFHMKSPEEMAEAFAHIPEAIANTVKIADSCDLEIPMGTNILPAFEVPLGETIDSYFDKKIQEGVTARFGDQVTQETLDRLATEIAVIDKAGFKGYMLIVADFVNWAKEQKIMVGPGRGSAAGSMVAFVLRITEVNPIEHNLLFERFLNPERISMPDIDMDFADDRRGEVIDYVIEKYGRDRVAQIITFGTMMSRAAVRDVGRALNMSYNEVDKIAKLVPPPLQGKYKPLREHIEKVPELAEMYKSDEAAKKLLDAAIKLEGTVRHASTHAAGVVIGDQDLRNYTPLQTGPSADKVVVTQYSMKPVEAIGLLKMDFLGLKNLTILQNALRIIHRIYDPEFDLGKLTFEDKKTYELLSAGNTTGVFQLEGEGMRRYLRELKPSTFNDISAMIALYRPGPIEFIPDYIDRKHGRKKIEYIDPRLAPILADTYGIAVFQEQVLQIARDLCGFSMGAADVLRKAIGKKDPKLLAEQKEKFVKGALENGCTPEIAGKLFNFVEPFALYGFNRAHTVSYAVISYWTAYLKVHFPSAFMAAVMTSAQQNLDDVARDIAECEAMGLKVLPPSVNKSFTGFAVVPETGEIVFGLNAVKNVGQKVSDLIVAERTENGPYTDIADFVKRAGRDVINRKTMESLIMAGALDEFGEPKMLLSNIEVILSFASSHYSTTNANQLGMFGEGEAAIAHKLNLAESVPATEAERLAWEREYLGTFVSNHPLKSMAAKLAGVAKPITHLTAAHDNQNAKVLGIVTRIQKVFTKNGDAMIFANLEDLAGKIEVIVFPKVLENTKQLWVKDAILLISGKVNIKERIENQGEEMVVITEPKILAGEVTELTDEYLNQLKTANAMLGAAQAAAVPVMPPMSRIEQNGEGLLIKLPRGFTNGKLLQLKEALQKHPGDSAVYLEIFADGRWQKVPTEAKATKTSELERELDSIFQ